MKAIEGLENLEKRLGSLRLDRGDHITVYHPDEWIVAQEEMRKLWPGPMSDESYSQGVARAYEEGVRISMFGNPVVKWCQTVAEKVVRSEWATLRHIPVACTSILIMNASTVKFDESEYGIALNGRLLSQLTTVNSLQIGIHEELGNRNYSEGRNLAKKIHQIMSLYGHGNDPRNACPKCIAPESATSLFRFRTGVALAQFQMAFILLHEYAHIIKGHLDREDSWADHPFSMSGAVFHTSSQVDELEADRVACDFLLQPTTLPTLAEPFGLVRLIPMILPWAIACLFVYFTLMIQLDVEHYYRQPRSHPHPSDRLVCVEETMQKYNSLYSMRMWPIFT